MNDADFDKIEAEFSKKKKKLCDKIKPLVGADAAVALVNLQGYGEASYAEIEMIAQLVSGFAPFVILEFSLSPKKVVLQGCGPAGHVVRVYPQYEVEQPFSEDGKRNSAWAIDVVVKLYRSIFGELVYLDALGYEYDGHSSHFLESGIKKAYDRDFNIHTEEGFSLIRIYPQSWKARSYNYKRGLHKFFERVILKTETIQRKTLERVGLANLVSLGDDLYDPIITCPLCNGRCKIGPDECVICRGMGSIAKTKSDSLDLSEYDEMPCPCSSQTECRFCKGTGVALRESLLNWK